LLLRPLNALPDEGLEGIMATTKCTIVGIFDDRETAETVAQELSTQGIGRNDIQVMSSDAYSEDVARGNAGLSGSAHQDSSGGGISGFFHRLFGSDTDEDERERYAEAVRRGSTVVAVTANEGDESRITDVMERYDPVDIDRRAESWKERGYTGRDSGTEPMTADEIARERQYDARDKGERSIPVVEEQIQVGKRPVQSGGVRVYRRTSEKPVEEKVQLREEHVRVDRRPADRPATEADLNASDQVIEVTEMAEEPVIGKRARVVEDVVLTKDTTERTETVRDKVRRSDVNVEKLGRGESASRSGAVDYDSDFRKDFQSRYGSDRDASYETYAPAYRYGYEMANDPRYRGKRWDDVESTFRTDYERNNPNGIWNRAKGAVRYGWDKVTGNR
jgi:uncharacterized protein (TIGR02271 family)